MSLAHVLPLAVVEIVGDLSLKQFANGGDPSFLWLGGASYVGVVFFLVRALRGSTVLYVNGAWDGLSTLLASAAAYLFLGERFDTKKQYVGLAMICGGLLLLHK